MSLRFAARALGVAELGHAQWFFGNLYEAVVRVPDLLAARDEPMSPTGPGSPLRYFAAALPGTVPALLTALIAARGERGARPWLVAATACSATGLGITAYLVRNVNQRLVFTDQPLTPAERAGLLRTWHRLNTVRLGAAAGAWLAAHAARSRVTP